MSLTVFGIRHHGQGCARSLTRALDELRPDVVVIEGPPDAEGLLSWVSNPSFKPPVALLVYPTDEPKRAVYYPMAVFSPEWQALTWAAACGVPARFMDLPQSHQLALEKVEEEKITADGDSQTHPEGAGEPDTSNPADVSAVASTEKPVPA